MPNRNTADEQDKLDHSTHPTTHTTKEDMRAPGDSGVADRNSGESGKKAREQPGRKAARP